VRPRATGSCQDRHSFRAIQLLSQAVEFFPAGNNLRLHAGEGDAPGLIDGVRKRDIAGNYDNCNAFLRQCRLDRNLKNARHLRRMRDQFAEMAALLE
jgi:hypothetical protein